MRNHYHATPYDISAPGFSFTDYDDYLAQVRTCRNDHGDPVEEFSLHMVDGDNEVLFNALEISQATLEQWFTDFEPLAGDDLIKAIYLSEYVTGDMADILDWLDEVSIFEGDAEAFIIDYIEDCGLLDDMPENLQHYFDTEAFARSLLLGGDITEVNIMGSTYIVREN
ncbi:antirestriction protein ArdA [Paremcibacter congregatus]|uniref:Antirestriction protein ArdA n=1 Tax=Paremcibacter congregatus TaxID=2043170 RepID=A0A2G4YNN7_9PROT|nr:antirestriction protein ArdA [Paremcibacter congregatus]PHZ83934.1 hypothetical protein CRD36_14470 [Paremcibacter congregatus]QDE28974.1 antirestriction protein ArdA [Paremcibacter congregatus]